MRCELQGCAKCGWSCPRGHWRGHRRRQGRSHRHSHRNGHWSSHRSTHFKRKCHHAREPNAAFLLWLGPARPAVPLRSVSPAPEPRSVRIPRAARPDPLGGSPRRTDEVATGAPPRMSIDHLALARPRPGPGYFPAFPRMPFQVTRERECRALGRVAEREGDRTEGHRQAGGPGPASLGGGPALHEEELPTWVCVWVAKGPPPAASTCTDNTDGVGRSNGPTHRRSHRDPVGPSHRPSHRRSHRPTPQKPQNRHPWKPTQRIDWLKSRLWFFF